MGSLLSTVLKDPDNVAIFFNLTKRLVKEFFEGPRRPFQAPENLSEEKKRLLRYNARQYFNINTDDEYNVAFCGQVKAGKSRMINALRGVREGEDGWAKVGYFHSTTTFASYRFKDTDGPLKKIVLWDFPGAGPKDVPVKDYFSKQMLYAFDLIVLFLGDAMREEDPVFALEAQEYNIPLIFVRSKCDITLEELFTKEKNSNRTREKIKDEFMSTSGAHIKGNLAACCGVEMAIKPLFHISAPVIESGSYEDHEFALEEHGFVAHSFRTLLEGSYA